MRDEGDEGDEGRLQRERDDLQQRDEGTEDDDAEAEGDEGTTALRLRETRRRRP